MLVLIYRPQRDGRLSWPWLAGWIHTEINVRHRKLNSDTVAHLCTNRAQRRLTSLIEANALTTTPDSQSASISAEIFVQHLSFVDVVTAKMRYRFEQPNRMVGAKLRASPLLKTSSCPCSKSVEVFSDLRKKIVL